MTHHEYGFMVNRLGSDALILVEGAWGYAYGRTARNINFHSFVPMKIDNGQPYVRIELGAVEAMAEMMDCYVAEVQVAPPNWERVMGWLAWNLEKKYRK